MRVADVVEVLEHWAAGRPLRAIAKSLGLDRNTVAKYVGPARQAGLGPGTGQASAPEKTRSLPQPAVVRARDDRQQFRILFLAERIVQATDMHDALRQAESFGAVEIKAVARVD